MVKRGTYNFTKFLSFFKIKNYLMRFVNANRPTEILVYGFRPRFRPLFLVGLNDLGENKTFVICIYKFYFSKNKIVRIQKITFFRFLKEKIRKTFKIQFTEYLVCAKNRQSGTQVYETECKEYSTLCAM